tara:strand:- start:16098 stop:17408 length:1311 start_codon:yes stop_codon:yes gene_type:complete
MTTDSFNKKTNESDEADLSEESLLELKKRLENLCSEFPRVDSEPVDPKHILDELVEGYKSNKSWETLKKKLSAKFYLDVINILRKEILGEAIENPSNTDDNFYDWVNFNKTNNVFGQNDFASPVFKLSQKSLFLCFFLNEKPFVGFNNLSNSAQTEMILELLSEVYFTCVLGSVVDAVESKNKGEVYYEHLSSTHYFFSKNTFIEGQILPFDVDFIKKSYIDRGFEYISEYSRTGLSKDQLFGFIALLNYGFCIHASYEHYQSQKNIKNKMNKKCYQLEHEALKALTIGQDFCFEALLLLGAERINDIKSQLSEANNEREKFRANSAKGGKEAAKLPDVYGTEMMKNLSDIIAHDKEQVLRVNDVANLLCLFMNQSSKRGLFGFKWEEKYSRSQSWFKDKIKLAGYKYLSSRGAPNKQKKQVLIVELKEQFGIERE